MAQTEHDVDVAVVGGGPTGLFATYAAGFRGLSVAIVDALPCLGGQVAALYPEKPIFDVPAFPQVSGRDLIARLEAQIAPFKPTLVLGEQAVAVEHLTGGRRTQAIVTGNGSVVRCSAVVITAGIGSMKARRLPAAQAFHGRGVEHFVTALDDYRNRDTVVVGGGDSAVDWAVLLEPVAASVTLVHRRDTFRAHRHSLDQLAASSVEVVTPAHVEAVGGDRWLEEVAIRRSAGELELRAASRLVAALGFTANLGPLSEWGLEIEDGRYIVVDSAMRTSVAGIFAAGDITAYAGKVRLMSVGFGEAATAVNHAARHIAPDAPVFPGHSTEHRSEGLRTHQQSRATKKGLVL